MTAEAVLTQVLNGLTIGAILMLIAMGLTVRTSHETGVNPWGASDEPGR